MRKLNIKRMGSKEDDDGIEKVPICFSLESLTMILAYVSSNNPLITRGNLQNVKKLFDMMDDRVYENNYEMMARFIFIKRALASRLEYYMDEPKMILDSCRSKKYEDIADEIIEDVLNLSMKATTIKYVTATLSDKLSHAYFYKYKDGMIDMFQRLNTGDYDSLRKFRKEAKKLLNGLMTEIRKAESMENMDNGAFSLMKDIFESKVAETVTELQREANILYTGVQKLNEILSPGFQAGRIYTILGLSGGFKSGTLLNLAYQIKLNNKKYKTKDPDCIPTLVMITQENSIMETIDRLFSLAVSIDRNDTMKNYTVKDAIKALRKKGKLAITLENNIDLVVIYRKGGSINTGDVDTILEEIEEEGREIVCLIHDYIERLRSVQYATDVRLELGYIIDELKAIAIQRNIPVITASQLNREASKTVDAGIECNKTDLARFLGSSNVSESWGIIKNSDWVCIVNKEMKRSTKQWYLTFKRLKIRYNPLTDLSYFNQPFDGDNTMRLKQDIDGPCLSEISLSNEFIVPEDADNSDGFGKGGSKNAKERKDVSKENNSKYTLFDLGRELNINI